MNSRIEEPPGRSLSFNGLKSNIKSFQTKSSELESRKKDLIDIKQFFISVRNDLAEIQSYAISIFTTKDFTQNVVNGFSTFGLTTNLTYGIITIGNRIIDIGFNSENGFRVGIYQAFIEILIIWGVGGFLYMALLFYQIYLTFPNRKRASERIQEKIKNMIVSTEHDLLAIKLNHGLSPFFKNELESDFKDILQCLSKTNSILIQHQMISTRDEKKAEIAIFNVSKTLKIVKLNNLLNS